MERVTFKILFVVKKGRVAKNGEAPVLLRVTVNGQRSETSINLKVDPDNWNAIAGRSVGSSRKDDELNAHLDTIRMRIMQIHREMELDKAEINAKTVIDKYLGKDKEPKIMLLDVFREHNERCRKLMGKDMAPATVKRYETSLRHTENFIRYAYREDDIPIEDVDHKFITDYELYLKIERQCNHNSTVKYLKNFKKIIGIALANDYIQKDPFTNIKFSFQEVERDFLEDHEIRKLMDKRFEIERLDQVRDIFVFCCFTGLAFYDVKDLSPEHIVRDGNGELWIRKMRQKTKNMCNIPLLDVPRSILEKYKDHPRCVAKGVLLPIPSNQRMNGYLVEVAELCGIKKKITTHTGRHSFATSVALANNVTLENVAKMLGHSNTNMTRHYARVLDKSIMRDMRNVNEKFTVQPK